MRIGTYYARASSKVLRHPSPRADAVGRTIRAIADADHLPGPADYEAQGRVVGRALVRRVGGRNLWVWYRFTDDEVVLVTVTTDPPVPLEQ